MNGCLRRTLALLAVGMLVSVAAPEAATSSRDASAPARIGAGGGTFLAAPMLWVLGALGLPVEAPAPLPNSLAIARGQGAQQLVFPLHDDGLAVYLEVRGRVEFERAEVRMADGAIRTVALGGVTRGRGLYELLDCGGTSRVDTVVLNARARSGEAEVGVRLGR